MKLVLTGGGVLSVCCTTQHRSAAICSFCNRSDGVPSFALSLTLGKGTGLGLSVVHGIVQGHEAQIEVQSAPGQGTSIIIYFPAAQVPVDVAFGSSQRIENEDISEALELRSDGKHVLYIDDDEAIVLLMTRLLERQGYRVSGYTNPLEALAAAQVDASQFDLVVTDHNMLEMSGLEVASALKEIRIDLPVAMASGYITDELREKAWVVGISELIYKPNTVEELCAAVARAANEQNGKERFF